jgi:hypothetical protein
MTDTDNLRPRNDVTDKPVDDDASHHFDKNSVLASDSESSETEKGEVDWTKKVLRQCVYVSRISSEIMKDIEKVDWDENCYEECRRLLLQETMRLGDVYGDRGVKKNFGLASREALRWTTEALGQAKRASRFVEDRFVKIGAERRAREEEQARRRLGVPIPTAKIARRIVLDAANKDPISDSHMEILVKGAFPKTPISPRAKDDQSATPCVERSKGGDTAPTFETATEFATDNQHEDGKTDAKNESGILLLKGVRVENPLWT